MDAWFSISTTVDSEDEEEIASKAVEARLKRRREIEKEKESRKRKKREAVLASIQNDDNEEKEEEEDDKHTRPPLPAFLSEAAQRERLPAFFHSEAAQRERLPAFLSEAAQRVRLPAFFHSEARDKAVKKTQKKMEDIFGKIRIVRTEKRLQRYRGTPSSAVRKRIERAKTQRLYMITWKRRDVGGEFIVLGSTGNVYNVTIGHVNSCSCPDARKGNLCKHQLFVLLKVLQEPSDSPIVWQRGFTDRELDILFRRLDKLTKKRTLCIHAIASDAVKRAYDQSTTTNAEVKQRPLSNDSECPICCEKLVNDDKTRDEPVVWCKKSCGNSVHAHCMQMWITQKQRSSPGSSVPCPFCRAVWSGTGTSTNNNEEGYLNLASQSGQSRTRPSYTPYNWRRSWKRRRRY